MTAGTRAVWHATTTGRGRGYQGRHQTPPRVSPQFHRGLRLAVAAVAAWWVAVTAAAVFGGWLPALAVAALPLLAGAVHALGARLGRRR